MYQIVSNIPTKIFRGYDIRGEVDKDLNENVYYTLGRAYATFLSRRRISEAAIGRDNRLTSDIYSKALIAGLNDGGINTYDIGASLSQIVYFSNYEFKTKGSAMITASHNPKEYNGVKLGTGYSETMVTEDIQNYLQILKDGKFNEPATKGQNSVQDIYPSYKKHLLKHFNLKKNWKIVVDASNTNSGIFYPDILRQVGCEVIEQNCEPDGNFPSGVPDPTEMEVLNRLAKRVLAEKADIGFAYDADGDRMAVVDDKGQTLWMDQIVAIFAQDVLEFIPGASIVYNTLCSRAVTENIEKYGGKPIMWVTGHSFIKAKLKECNAPFAGELSGHIFFNDNFYGHDDGAYASLRLLSFLERHKSPLSTIAAALPSYISSPEIKFGLADEIKFEFIAKTLAAEFKQLWPDAKFIDIDGIRMDKADRMAIVRASQNGPYITVKFEGKTQEIYDEMKKILRELLKKYQEIDWSVGVNTHALD